MLLVRFLVLAVSLLLASAAWAESDAWSDIRQALFQGRAGVDDGRSVRIIAPSRAEDAALVPIVIYVAAELAPHAKELTLIIDQNPSPVVAVFHFGDAYRLGSDVGDRTIETRVRLDSMSPVRVVLETANGQLYTASQFVAGAGGCSSSSVKDLDEAMASIGRMRLHIADDPTRGKNWHELRLQIRHPNFSGMQIDAKTNSYFPARFVENVAIDIDGAPLLTVDGGMSIAEHPSFRISFAKSGPFEIAATVRDTAGSVFRAQTAVAP